ncbi:hypothetical protein B0H14DRAFT_3767680 [Mycena olivaceomarginata]|nr:hypothetical protein B0H14DRAFT_3767680 [Mycena olivaceomarginata]
MNGRNGPFALQKRQLPRTHPGTPLGRPLHGTVPQGLRADDKRRAGARRRGKGGEDGDEDGQKKGKRRKIGASGRDTQIHPGETLTRFNKRIEADVRPLVRSAVHSSLATARAQHKKGAAPAEPTSSAAPTNSQTLKSAPASKSESTPAFKTTSTPDAQAAPPPIDKYASTRKNSRAPPELFAFGRKKSGNPTSSSNHQTPPGKASVLSPVQQLAMSAAREVAGRRYRALKASRRTAGGGDGGERGGGGVVEGGMSRG